MPLSVLLDAAATYPPVVGILRVNVMAYLMRQY